MSQKSLAQEKGQALFENVICSPEKFPLSFRYAGKEYSGLGGLECISKSASETAFEGTWKADDCLAVKVIAKYCADYGQSEYTVYFENTGAAPSGVLSDIAALDTLFEGENCTSRGILGDHQNYYAPYDIDLNTQAAHFESLGGRATHVCFPYFDLVHGDGGTLIALGWAGTWDALFTCVKGGARAKIRSIPALKAQLMPGETIRTGLIVLLPYAGRDRDSAMNLWREWFVSCNMPRYDASGKAIDPFTTAFFAYDTGLPNSDGSISERHFTWKLSLDKVVAEKVTADFRWFDAGWYPDPAGNTVETDWWGTVGTWQIDKEKWPGDTFRQSVEGFHEHGMKTLVWFEPERVTHVDDLVKNHGYKREWAIEAGGAITNNIGDPECLKWTADRIISMMDENGVDLYREDNNANHNQTWEKLDRQNTRAAGFPRWGIAENNSIVGHYDLWDTIIGYCARSGKCTFVDSCASGGGRNDIESLRRGIPFMRSDADRTTTALRLSMSASFNQWIPFHGANTKETEGQLDASTGAGSDKYVYRASYLPVFNYGEQFVHNPDLDYDMMRRYIGEWKSIKHLLVRDMYILTPWHSRDDMYGWTAFAYDDPDAGDSVLIAFRMEKCADDRCKVRLPFARNECDYILENCDNGRKNKIPGFELAHEVILSLKQPRSCLMYRIRRV